MMISEFKLFYLRRVVDSYRESPGAPNENVDARAAAPKFGIEPISCFAHFASRRVVGQWRGAGGAICEDHFALTMSVKDLRAATWRFFC